VLLNEYDDDDGGLIISCCK